MNLLQTVQPELTQPNPQKMKRQILFLAILACSSFCSKSEKGFLSDEHEKAVLDDSHVVEFQFIEESPASLMKFNQLQAFASALENSQYFSLFHFHFSSCSLQNITCDETLIHWTPIEVERTCLLSSNGPRSMKTIFSGNMSVEEIVHFINQESKTFFGIGGTLTEFGKYLELLQGELNSVPPALDNAVAECDRIRYSDMNNNRSVFLRYLLTQKPVVVSNYPTISSSAALRTLQRHASETVGTKLSPSVEFEGIDSLDNWEMARTQVVPEIVLDKLQARDIVVVRAAHAELKLGDVLDIIATSSRCGSETEYVTQNCSRANAYVEYYHLSERSDMLKELLPHLHSLEDEEDFDGWNAGLPHWVSRLLLNGKAHLWVGDGRTTGKLHYDPFDNILIQLAGSKSFLLADPSDNAAFYEGHLREAELELAFPNFDEVNVNLGLGERIARQAVFRRRKLTESTSMVHSPIGDLENPNSRRFPKSSGVNQRLMRCSVSAGEALFVPSFWWHEVISTPSEPLAIRARSRNPEIENKLSLSGSTRLNVAVNYWFDPLFSKEFPCADCRKKPNAHYNSFFEENFRRRTDLISLQSKTKQT